MTLQTCMSDFLLWNTNQDIMQNVLAALFHAILLSLSCFPSNEWRLRSTFKKLYASINLNYYWSEDMQKPINIFVNFYIFCFYVISFLSLSVFDRPCYFTLYGKELLGYSAKYFFLVFLQKKENHMLNFNF